jgi:hypothetical protein
LDFDTRFWAIIGIMAHRMSDAQPRGAE